MEKCGACGEREVRRLVPLLNGRMARAGEARVPPHTHTISRDYLVATARSFRISPTAAMAVSSSSSLL